MNPIQRKYVAILFCLLVRPVFCPALLAEEPFRYPEATYGKGQLKYIDNLPVLTVSGSPEEMGEQIGRLALKPARQVPEALWQYFKNIGSGNAILIAMPIARGIYDRFPQEYRRELDAMAKAANVDHDQIVLANTFLEIGNLLGCSSLLVSAERSKTGKPLLGRNLDFGGIAAISRSGLIIVYHPTGKQSYAIATFPGLLATGTGMNEHGLVLATHSISGAADGSRFNPKGLSIAVSLRRGFEECSSVDDVEKWLRAHPLMSKGALAVSDPKTQAILEVTPKTVARRGPVDGICCATNHFRTPELATSMTCRRFDALEKSRDIGKLSVDDVARLMHAANSGAATIQTVVFEPATLTLHASLGIGPTSARPLHTLDLTRLLQQGK